MRGPHSCCTGSKMVKICLHANQWNSSSGLVIMRIALLFPSQHQSIFGVLAPPAGQWWRMFGLKLVSAELRFQPELHMAHHLCAFKLLLDHLVTDLHLMVLYEHKLCLHKCCCQGLICCGVAAWYGQDLSHLCLSCAWPYLCI